MDISAGACHEYQLVVSTGVWRGSGTTGVVTIVIHGSEVESEPIVIQKHMTRGRLLLMRGNDDVFTLKLPISFGSIQFLHIRHDNSGKSPSWFLRHVFLIRQDTGEKFTFICNRWFGLAKDDGKIERIIPAASTDDLSSFNYSYNVRSSKSLAEGHLWLSVIMKPPKDSFTRVQRSTCCLTLLFSAMMANAMFYGVKPHFQPAIQIGPLKFNWTQIIIGLESCLIVTPVNLLIAYIFKNARPNPSSASKQKNRVTLLKRLYNGKICSKGLQKVECDTKESTRTLEKRKFGKFCSNCRFPHWFIFVAWLLCIITIAVSASITFFYSLQWGKTISNEWLSSMLVSFTEDLFVLQPVKVCLITVVLAYVATNQRTTKNNSTGLATSCSQNDITTNSFTKLSHPAADLKEKDLEVAREFAIKEKKMFSIFREIVSFLIFLVLLSIVCYGAKTKHGYMMSKATKESISKFSKVSDKIVFVNNSDFCNLWH